MFAAVTRANHALWYFPEGLWVLDSISYQISTGIDHVDTYGVAWAQQP